MDSNDKVFGVLGYFGLLFLVPLLAGKTEFTRFHANQGLVLFLAEVVLGIVVGIVSVILGFIPIIGAIIGGILSGALGIASVVLMIMGIVSAAQGEMKPLPIIGGIKIIK
ncbi:MAG: DUF4870 domain-containing protein [Oscillospiraceae bacterium]|nr:DUF4870 domain-containing protein [Oscillospiraceae bacterium]